MDAILSAARALAERAVEAARALTQQGERIDDHQVVVERVAYAATEARVIAERAEGPASGADAARVASAELAASIRHRLEPIAAQLNLGELPFVADEALAPAAVEAIGAAAMASEGRASMATVSPAWSIQMTA